MRHFQPETLLYSLNEEFSQSFSEFTVSKLRERSSISNYCDDTEEKRTVNSGKRLKILFIRSEARRWETSSQPSEKVKQQPRKK